VLKPAPDQDAVRRLEKAGAAGLALLLAAMAGAGWVAAGAIPGRSNGGTYVECTAFIAAMPCALAAYATIQLMRGRTSPSRAIGWFVAACAALVFLLFVAAVSNSNLS
jgi:hypothetical protein